VFQTQEKWVTGVFVGYTGCLISTIKLRTCLVASHTVPRLSFGGVTVCGVEICRHTLGIEWHVKLVAAPDPYKANSLPFSLAPPQAVAWQFVAGK
jgi:hypothetical protein